MDPERFPSAYYKDGVSRVIYNEDEADAAEREGWRDRPTHLPAPPPEPTPHPHPPSTAADHEDARPRLKKKGE